MKQTDYSHDSFRKRRKKAPTIRGLLCLLIATTIIMIATTITLLLNDFTPFDIATALPALNDSHDDIINLTHDTDIYLNSRHAVLMELNGNHDTIYDLSGNEQIYPASLTKIMTAGFQPNEMVTVLDLLYGMMLPSGAECAIGLSESIAGSTEEFAKLMNQKAIDLGMTNTHFTNETGRHDDNQYTTAYDLSILLEYALKNELFYDIFTTHSYATAPTNRHPEGLILQSSMFSKTPDMPYDFELLGGKTGYTTQAGQCLASLAEKNGQTYLLVTAGAKVKSNIFESKHVEDAVTLYSSID